MYGGLLDHDDPRGFRKRKTLKQIILRHAGLFGWVIAVILIVALFRSHRHRSTLASEIETHQETNKELRKQFSNKYRELADVRRESKKALSTAEQHKAEVQRWEGEHSRCQDELTAITVELHEKQDELGRLKNELQVEKNRSRKSERSANAAQSQLKILQDELKSAREEIQMLKDSIDALALDADKNGSLENIENEIDDVQETADSKTQSEQDTAQEVPKRLSQKSFGKLRKQDNRDTIPNEQGQKIESDDKQTKDTIKTEASVPKNPEGTRRQKFTTTSSNKDVETPDQQENGRTESDRKFRYPKGKKRNPSMLEEHMGVERGNIRT